MVIKDIILFDEGLLQYLNSKLDNAEIAVIPGGSIAPFTDYVEADADDLAVLINALTPDEFTEFFYWLRDNTDLRLSLGKPGVRKGSPIGN